MWGQEWSHGEPTPFTERVEVRTATLQGAVGRDVQADRDLRLHGPHRSITTELGDLTEGVVPGGAQPGAPRHQRRI
jgi:hypothetical protein